MSLRVAARSDPLENPPVTVFMCHILQKIRLITGSPAAAFALHVLGSMPLTARDLLKGHFCIVPIQSGGIAGDLPVVVLQVEMCWITKLIGISNLSTLVGIRLALLPRHVLTAPVRRVVVVAVPATVRDLEDPANTCFWLAALRRSAGGAQLVALTAVQWTPTLVRVIVQIRAVHGSRILRQGPKVMIHVATATTATGATGGVLIPSGAGTEFPVLLWRATRAFAVQRNSIALTASRRAHWDRPHPWRRRPRHRRRRRRVAASPGRALPAGSPSGRFPATSASPSPRVPRLPPPCASAPVALTMAAVAAVVVTPATTVAPVAPSVVLIATASQRQVLPDAAVELRVVRGGMTSVHQR